MKNLIAIGRSGYLFKSIEFLADKGYNFIAIVTQDAYDEYYIKSDDFKKLASRLGAAFLTTKNLYDPLLIRLIKENQIEAAISANWKYTIPKNFLDLFNKGILNFHLGNLPNYKGNATVNWSIINGEKYIYANIHKMDTVLDAGDILSRKKIPITNQTYVSDIMAKAENAAPLLYLDALKNIYTIPNYYKIKGTVEGVRCYPRIPEDSQINWEDSMEAISRLVRASSYPYNGAYSYLNGEKVKIWKAKPSRSSIKYMAIPGQVLELNKTTGTILVACKKGLLEVEEIEHSGVINAPTCLINSIRSRFKFHPDV